MDLSQDSPVKDLTDAVEADSAFTHIATWMLKHPSRSFGTCLPGLWLIRDETIRDACLPARAVTVLSRLGVNVWGDTLELSPSILLDMHGFREGRGARGGAAGGASASPIRVTSPILDKMSILVLTNSR